MKKTLHVTFAIFLMTIFGHAQTTFEPKITINPNTGDNPYTIASGLIDSDAFVDVILGTDVANTLIWYKNNGDNTFTAQTPIANTFSGIGGLKLVDLNNDTFLDALITAYSSDSVTWHANDGNGNFGPEQPIATVSGASGLFVGDVDGNTTPDVVVTAYDGNQVLWFSNDGAGNFTTPTTSIIDATLTSPGAVNMKDIDNDGDLDALVATAAYSGDVLHIFRNDLVPSGTTTFTKDASAVTTGKIGFFNAAFTDLDGDANLDILATEVSFGGGPTGNLYWYEDNGAGFTENIFTTDINNPAVAQVHDLDGDGIKDIILSNGQGEAIESGNTDISWFKNNGDGTFGTENIIETTQSQVFVYTINDFDNDTDLDIMSASYGQDDLNYLRNNLIVLSVDDVTENTINIYPNPAKNVLIFKGLTPEILTIEIFDILGKMVINTTIEPNGNLDISKLKSGLYIITIKNYNETFKLVKE